MTTSEISRNLLSAQWLAYINNLNKEPRDIIDPFERAIMDLRVASGLTNRQFQQLTDVRNSINNDVANYFNALQPGTPQTVSTTPGLMVLAHLTFVSPGAPFAPYV